MLYNQDSIEFIKSKEDLSVDIYYADPPYALGSESMITDENKVEYKKAKDFMSKWDAPTGEYWEEWFKEAYRTTKHGGYCIMFGIDRQLLMFKYYALMAGFEERQSLYWFFISSFTKSADLSKNIDRRLGNTREVVGFKEVGGEQGTMGGYRAGLASVDGADVKTRRNIEDTAPTSELGIKYNGYRYSTCPLKQTNETILVFQKPYKTGSCMGDTLLLESGDNECACGALNIESNRIEKDDVSRYPAQTFVDTKVSEILGDKSKILNVCDFDPEELYFYFPKVGSRERNDGCENLTDSTLNRMREDKCEATGLNKEGRFAPTIVKNNHPTLKPIALNESILKLFKTPNEQVIVYPFAGSGSEIIGGYKAGFTNWSACEINKDYCRIAIARINHWTDIDIIDEYDEEYSSTSVTNKTGINLCNNNNMNEEASGTTLTLATYNFGEVINWIKGDSSHLASRLGWNGKGMSISLQMPDEQSANTLPYIYMITVDGNRVPWLASQTDMLAEDWVLKS